MIILIIECKIISMQRHVSVFTNVEKDHSKLIPSEVPCFASKLKSCLQSFFNCTERVFFVGTKKLTIVEFECFMTNYKTNEMYLAEKCVCRKAISLKSQL